ncbi:MAG: lipopolysaccharide transport periplasmic protein LptA [Betaproteobacteria bacterium]|nr:lipopolysaccharide transport periplasmic protein LptA [Betaproteobacteria bacterium]
MRKNDRRAEPLQAAPLANRCVLLALACALYAVVPAHAERSDRSKPVNLEADRVTVDESKQTATFEGNVVLTQGTLMIRGDRMIVQQDAEGFKTGVAQGNLASFRQKREGLDEYVEGFAERIEYDSKADKVQMFNRAHLTKGNDDVRGNYISYDATTEFFRVTGGGKQAATASNPEGRVRAIIQPKSREKAPDAPPLPLKPATDVANPREPSPGAAR